MKKGKIYNQFHKFIITIYRINNHISIKISYNNEKENALRVLKEVGESKILYSNMLILKFIIDLQV